MVPILYLAPVEWSSIWQRPQQLAVRLGRHFRVHYVDPVGLRSVRVRDFARIRSAWRAPAQSASYPVITPRYLPWPGNRLVEPLNRRWLMRQIAAQFDLQQGQWILWLGSPSLLADELIRRAKPSLVVYDSMDRVGAFHHGRTRQRIEQTEARLVSRADLVFASSHGLAERWRSFKEVVLVPNGVDAAAFDHRRADCPPEWHRDTSRRVIGFHGTLGDWLDYDLLARLAQRHADWLWVLIGPVHSQRAKTMSRLPNVCMPGPVPYPALAQHAAWFDVGLIPFRLNELTRYVHPIKALEYLALGLPVVSARLPDLSEHSEVLSFASTFDEWSARLEDAVAPAARLPKRVEARRRVARAHDWDRRVESIIACINAVGRARQPDAGAAHDHRLRRWSAAMPSQSPASSLRSFVPSGEPC